MWRTRTSSNAFAFTSSRNRRMSLRAAVSFAPLTVSSIRSTNVPGRVTRRLSSAARWSSGVSLAACPSLLTRINSTYLIGFAIAVSPGIKLHARPFSHSMTRPAASGWEGARTETTR
jgi:hypothetical protein